MSESTTPDAAALILRAPIKPGPGTPGRRLKAAWRRQGRPRPLRAWVRAGVSAWASDDATTWMRSKGLV